MSRITNKQKQKILIELTNNPNASIACKRIGIARSTYYRWYGEDMTFRLQCDDVIMEGTEMVSDLAESHLISLIKSDHYWAMKYWLDNHRYPYRKDYEIPKRKIFFDLFKK